MASRALDRPLRGGPATTSPAPRRPGRGPPAPVRPRPRRPSPTTATAARSSGSSAMSLRDGDPAGQGVHAQRPLRVQAAGRAAPAPASPSRRSAATCAGPDGSGVQHGDLRLQRARAGLEHDPARRLVDAGRLRSLTPASAGVGRVGQPQQHPLRRTRCPAWPSSADRSVVNDRPQPDRRTLAQQLQHGLDEAPVVVLLEGRVEALPPVEQQQHPGQPLGRVVGGALLGQPGEALGGQQLLAAADLAAQLGQQPLDPVGLVPGHDRAAVRQPR